MGWNDWSEHPRQTVRLDALSNVEKAVSSTPIKISGISVSEQAGAAEVVRFTLVSAGTEHFSINIGANETKFFPIHAAFASLAAICDSAGNVDVTVFGTTAVLGTTVV